MKTVRNIATATATGLLIGGLALGGTATASPASTVAPEKGANAASCFAEANTQTLTIQQNIEATLGNLNVAEKKLLAEDYQSNNYSADLKKNIELSHDKSEKAKTLVSSALQIAEEDYGSLEDLNAAVSKAQADRDEAIQAYDAIVEKIENGEISGDEAKKAEKKAADALAETTDAYNDKLTDLSGVVKLIQSARNINGEARDAAQAGLNNLKQAEGAGYWPANGEEIKTALTNADKAALQADQELESLLDGDCSELIDQSGTQPGTQ